ncbi:transposase domain protein [Leptospira kirschneri str. H1]|uniref:Transposase domain protein n=1 Tax=Leptospira kirschneri str. H1 TaxID=1049966 RepID=A0A0E2B4F9_9LEPT|nr:transposase domain protein [Leptospira kirschneri str. H1]
MKRRSNYSPEFREQAVNRTLSGSFTIKEVQSKSKPIVHEIRSWMNKKIVDVAPKSSMGKALSYLAELSYAEE